MVFSHHCGPAAASVLQEPAPALLPEPAAALCSGPSAALLPPGSVLAGPAVLVHKPLENPYRNLSSHFPEDDPITCGPGSIVFG